MREFSPYPNCTAVAGLRIESAFFVEGRMVATRPTSGRRKGFSNSSSRRETKARGRLLSAAVGGASEGICGTRFGLLDIKREMRVNESKRIKGCQSSNWIAFAGQAHPPDRRLVHRPRNAHSIR